MLILHDIDTLLHDTVELLGAKIIPALESSERIKRIIDGLKSSPHCLESIRWERDDSTKVANLHSLIRETHPEGYIKHLETVFDQWREEKLVEEDGSILPECFAFATRTHHDQLALSPPKDIFARPGFYAFDMSSGIMKDTYRSVLASANLAVEGIKRLRGEGVDSVLSLCRPPGHHCDGRRAGGYCYLNNCALAVSAWRHSSPDARVAILDVDYHHGNGTQDIFYRNSSVLYTSIHGEDEFPYYTGGESEKGTGDAVGANINFPLAKDSSFAEYLGKLKKALSAIETFGPGLLLVSLGFDTFRLDPLGRFDIDTEDYEVMARTISERFPDVPSLLLLEGGYSLEHLSSNLISFLSGWESI